LGEVLNVAVRLLVAVKPRIWTFALFRLMRCDARRARGTGGVMAPRVDAAGSLRVRDRGWVHTVR
jgi:hypothetical protein